MNDLCKRLLGWLQQRCFHPDKHITLDLLEGDGHGFGVKWCRICGAVRRYRITHKGVAVTSEESEWRVPRADWWIGE